MSFATPLFLWYFLPATLLAYWVLPARFRNGVLSVASLVFYTLGAGSFTLLLLGCIVVNYAAGLAVDSERLRGRTGARRALLVSVVVVDLGILAVWKYAGFASRQIDAMSSMLGLGDSPVVALALPIGISFFTFHHLSYVVDVYRGSRPAQRNPLTFVTYIAMFPQLVAGPIVRYHEISDQLGEVRRNRLDDVAEGFPRFALGLAKKVIVADTLAPVADAAFASSAADGGPTSATAWVGVVAYTLQIYFDFSGYSDMAIGLARMFGFRFPENFARPYSASSVTDFWRRWHMSLSRWFRDYVYIPLGGNRGGAAATYRNLLLVFVLTGFWHGANWTFLVWGLFHGAWLVAERVTGTGGEKSGAAAALGRVRTLAVVMVGWVFFRAEDLGTALAMLKAMVVPTGAGLSDEVSVALTNRALVVLLLAALVVLMPPSVVLGREIERPGRRAATLRWGYAVVAAPVAAVVIAAGTFSPFLYFQF